MLQNFIVTFVVTFDTCLDILKYLTEENKWHRLYSMAFQPIIQAMEYAACPAL